MLANPVPAPTNRRGAMGTAPGEPRQPRPRRAAQRVHSLAHSGPFADQHAQAGALQRSLLKSFLFVFKDLVGKRRPLATAAENKVFDSIFVFCASGSETTSSLVKSVANPPLL